MEGDSAACGTFSNTCASCSCFCRELSSIFHLHCQCPVLLCGSVYYVILLQIFGRQLTSSSCRCARSGSAIPPVTSTTDNTELPARHDMLKTRSRQRSPRSRVKIDVCLLTPMFVSRSVGVVSGISLRRNARPCNQFLDHSRLTVDCDSSSMRWCEVHRACQRRVQSVRQSSQNFLLLRI